MCVVASRLGSVSVRNVYECVATVQFLINADTKYGMLLMFVIRCDYLFLPCLLNCVLSVTVLGKLNS